MTTKPPIDFQSIQKLNEEKKKKEQEKRKKQNQKVIQRYRLVK